MAWYLHAGKERSELDAQQWKGHSEQLEAELEEGRKSWAGKEQSFEQQIQDINVSRLGPLRELDGLLWWINRQQGP